MRKLFSVSPDYTVIPNFKSEKSRFGDNMSISPFKHVLMTVLANKPLPSNEYSLGW